MLCASLVCDHSSGALADAGTALQRDGGFAGHDV
jgi:hypothetical protein